MDQQDDAAELQLHADHCQRMADNTQNEEDKNRWQTLADRCRAMLAKLGDLTGRAQSDSA